jgi:D-3-phosphoglycerate dehydrogenase
VTDHSFRVLLADQIAPEGVRVLEDAAGIQVDDRAGIDAGELEAVVGEYDALIVRSRTRVTARILEAGQRLRVVGRAGVGVDNIDVVAAEKRGITVLNAPGGNVVSAAELTMALMLSLVRHVPQAAASLKRGEWERDRFKGIELNGKTLGLIGAGRIGAEVAKRGLAFGMRVIIHDPYLSEQRARDIGAELVPLDELFRAADLVSIHAPMTAETRGLVGSDELAMMKPTAYLINAARGGIVDEAALEESLRSGKLAGAALDVFQEEPIAADNTLLRLDNVIAIAHLGAATHEAQTLSGIEICKAVRDALVTSASRPAVGV